MGSASSVSPAAAPAPTTEKGKDHKSEAGGGGGGEGKTSVLKANEAVVFNFIRKNMSRPKPAIPLINILRESRACNNFQRYIRETFKDDLISGGMEEPMAEASKEMAFNYLQFWLDASDFTLFSASSFRNFRAERICERYLAHGARNLLPFSRLMVDDIIQKRDSEGAIPGDLFTPAQNEAYEFLEAEVLPLYLACEGPTGYRMVQKLTSMLDRLRRTNTATKTNQSTSDAFMDLHSKLSVILWDPLATRAFKDYLSTVNAAELLIFFLEVTDFKEMFTAVLSQESKPVPTSTTGEKDLVSRNFHYFLTRSHKIYDKFLKLGSSLRELFSDKDLADLVRRVSNTSELNPSLFDDLKDKKSEQNQSFQKLVQARSERRKKSLEYIRNRRKMLNVAKAVTVVNFLSPQLKLQKRSSSGGQDMGKDTAELETILAEDQAELIGMLSTNTSARFQQYLLEQQEAHKLLFWFEIEEFKSIPHTQTVFVQGRAQKIFDKYIKRGAPLELMLDPYIRNQLVAAIDRAHLNLFDGAQQAIFDSLLQEHELYQEFLKEKGDRKRQATAYSHSTSMAVMLEITLAEILSFPILCSSFKKFVETEFCVEPLMFWLEVEEYKRLPRSQYMQNRCRKIFNRYVRAAAPMAITITAEARRQAVDRMEDPGPLCFQSAENEVYAFMENCLLPKFRKSAEYQELLRNIETERKQAYANKPDVEMEMPMSPGNPEPSPEGPMTLKNLLSNQAGIKYFKEFLESRHCEENLLFWLEAEDFKDIPGKDFLKIRARKIVNKYIVEDAKQQVNIPHSIRKELLAALEHPSRNIFQKAQMEIFKLMQKDSYPPFLNSEQYKAYQDILQGSQDTAWSAILRRRSGNTYGGQTSKESSRASSYEKSQS